MFACGGDLVDDGRGDERYDESGTEKSKKLKMKNEKWKEKKRKAMSRRCQNLTLSTKEVENGK